jgi:hypothetical protein
MVKFKVFEYHGVIDGIRIPLETIRIKLRRCSERSLDSFPNELASIKDTATNEANPDIIWGNITVDLLDPILELRKRPLPWICPKHRFVCHGRFWNGL